MMDASNCVFAVSMLDIPVYKPSSAPEKPRDSRDISSNAEISAKAQEALVDLQFDTAITRISHELLSLYGGRGIEFDIVGFERKMRESMEAVRKSSSVPMIAKKKFLEDVIARTKLLSRVSEEDILNLRRSRGEDSLSLESRELEQKYGTGPDAEKKIKGFYLAKILEKTMGEYVEPAAFGLRTAFVDEKAKRGDNEYSKGNLDRFGEHIRKLDTAYGLDVASELRALEQERTRK